MAKEKSEKKTEEKDVEMQDVTEKSPRKSKKEKEEIIIPLEDLSPIAHPLAQRKLAKRLHRTIKKASKARQVKRGVKEVVKGIRKGESGYRIFEPNIARADINPMDIISHLPVLCEEATPPIPYVFVPSKEELGHASSTKRPTSCVMICPNQKRKAKKEGEGEDKDEDYQEVYEQCFKEVEKLDAKIVF